MLARPSDRPLRMSDPAPPASTPPAAADRLAGASVAPPRADEPAPASRWNGLWWSVLAVAAVELIGHAVVQSRVATRDQWADALALVRDEWQPTDLVVAAPEWADPLLREAAGDLVDRPMAGRSDTAAYGRMWVVSVRGHRAPEAPEAPPELERDFGPVHVSRWALPAPSVLFDFVDHVGEARVTRRERGEDLPCRLVQSMGNTQGGLANGPIEGAPRHLCDPARPWLWVGATTTMDLELRGRRCISTHAAGEDPIVTRYDDVPLGSSVVVHGGIWWERERWRNGSDVVVVVRLDGEELGRMTHRDGDGWKRMEAAVPEARRGGRGTVSFEVSSVGDPNFRAFCWAASSRGSPP
jgi:hypothetical protein